MNTEYGRAYNITEEKINMELWYVYIMSNKPSDVLYIDITDNIEGRVKSIS
ncbi:hypothetical protein [Aestuariivivens sediminis]|uniref:hypothetical protein n=1 Tax=Aestuariivivens sediminis TaxID=2913557 RepID=UPI0030B856D2